MATELPLTESGDQKRKNDEPVLFREDVDDSSKPSPGAVVDLVADGAYRGRGFYSDSGTVAVHVLSGGKVTVDRSFFRERIEAALNRRRRWMEDRKSLRLVHGEGDLLPGLVVDRLGDCLSIQLRSQAMDRRCDSIVSVLEELESPGTIVHRGDVSVREQLGLKQTVERLAGEAVPDLVHIQEEPYITLADVMEGQKTGYYLDQESNRRRLWSLNDPGRCLDCFSYSGGWGMALLWAGAEHVTFVDRSERALELVREHLRQNDWEDRATVVRDDGFDFLEDALEEDQSYDTVVLDPPAFAKGGTDLRDARRGYVGINFRAMRLLKPEGLLVTSSCSHPMDMETFTGVVQESAHDAHVTCQIIEQRHQSPDHPWLSNDLRSQYLSCIMAYISLA